MDILIRIIEAITPLVQAMAWPLLVLFLIIHFSKPLVGFLENISSVKIKAANVEMSASREQIKAAALVGAASQKRADGSTENELDIGDIADAVYRFPRRKTPESDPPRILWVDDAPSNNDYPREAMEQLGIEFGTARSTDEALKKIGSYRYDLIISDMGRPPDESAGYTLLDALRDSGNQIPFVIYTGSRSPDHQLESIQHGAMGYTNRVDELIALVSKGILETNR